MLLKFEREGTKVTATDNSGKVVMEDKLNSNYGRYFGKESVFFADCEVDNGMVLVKGKSSETF